MKVLGIDLETTGLDTQKCDIIEIGLVVWDTEKKSPERIAGEIVQLPHGNDFPAEIEAITGISEEQTRTASTDIDQALDLVRAFAEGCEAYVAHNGLRFDMPVLSAAVERNGHDPLPLLSWIDTSIDPLYPPHIKTRKLTHLAADHGAMPLMAHRAVFDVLMMFNVIEAGGYSWEHMYRRSSSPLVTKIAKVEYRNRHMAKEAGFYWCAEEKLWLKHERDDSEPYLFDVDIFTR